MYVNQRQNNVNMRKTNSIPKSSERLYKYRILELLNKLPHEQYKKAKRYLGTAIGVSPRTFHDWCYIKINDGRSIPADKMISLAKYFDVKPDEIFTIPPKDVNKEVLNEMSEKAMRQDYKLK